MAKPEIPDIYNSYIVPPWMIPLTLILLAITIARIIKKVWGVCQKLHTKPIPRY